MSKVLTPARRARLEKLAVYLEGLPADYSHFNMVFWVIDSKGDVAEAEYARHNGGVANCGTAACAAGHGPAAGVFVPPRFIGKYSWGMEVDWSLYSYALFAGNPDNSDWLFAGSWETIDNHHYGAAARIRYLLDKGKPPKGFRRPLDAWLAEYAPYRIDASADTRRMAETALAGSGRSPSGAVPAKQGDAQ